MRRSKKADRAGLHASRPTGTVGLVRRRGRPVPGRAASWNVMAAARPPCHPTARVCPRRHDQDPDPVPSRLRPGAAAIGRAVHQRGAASMAARAPHSDPCELPVPTARDPATTHAAWEVWQAGLTMRFTLPENLPPLRLL